MLKRIHHSSHAGIPGGVKAFAIGCGLMLALTAAADYTQLESIKADGKVWIYSGFKPSCTDRIEISFKATSGNTAALYCARGNSAGKDTFTAFIINNGGNSVRLDRNASTTGPFFALSLNEQHTLVVDGATLKATWDGGPVDGDLMSGDFAPGSAFTLFGSHTLGASVSEATGLGSIGNLGTHTLYAFKVYSVEGNLLADMVPARDDAAADGTTAQYGLFDRVDHTFHKGLGTGKFTPGEAVGETGGLGRGSVSCVWIGGSSDKWSDADNWADGRKPEIEYRDMATFDLADGDIDCENDIEGLTLTRLVTVNGTADRTFTLRGKGLTITGGDTSDKKTSGSFVGSSKVYCYAPLTLTGDKAAINSVNGASYFYGGLTLTGENFYFTGGASIYFYDNPVVGRNTTFQSGGNNMVCYFYAPVRVKKFVAGMNGCTGTGHFYCTGNEWDQFLDRYYATPTAWVENAFPTNMVFEWEKDYDSDEDNYKYDIYADQLVDRISQPEPFVKNGVIIRGVQIRAQNTTTERTLTLRGTDDAIAYCKLVNKLSLVWDPVGAFTQTLADRDHPTRGTLTVKGGTLASAGTNRFASVTLLTVHDGATFKVEDSAYNSAANPFSGATDLILHGTGAIDVPAGVTVTFANTLVRGRLLDAKTYQAMDGADAEAEKASWIRGAGLVRVTGCVGTSWINAGNGDWGEAANWSHGVPDGTAPVYVALEGTPFRVDFGAADVWPARLLIYGRDATLRLAADASVDYDGSDKTSSILVEEGGTLLVDGGLFCLTNYTGTFKASSSSAATSRVAVASGTFRYSPKASDSPLTLAKGGELQVTGGTATILMSYAGNVNSKNLVLPGGRTCVAGTGNLVVGKPSGSFEWGVDEGTFRFDGSAVLSKSGGEMALYSRPVVGKTVEMTFVGQSRLYLNSGTLALGLNSGGGKSTLNLFSEGSHTLPYRTIVGNQLGSAELNMTVGYVAIGARGLDVGGAHSKIASTGVEGVFNLSGGGLSYSTSDLAGWGCASKILGFNVGYGAMTSVTSGHPYVGVVNQTGGSITNKLGVTTVGTGYGKGTWRMSGGNFKTVRDSFYTGRHHFIGLAGGIGRLEMTGGTFDVGTMLYVGGAFTNALFKPGDGLISNGYPIDRHDAEGTVVFSNGTFAVGQNLVLGADGRGTIERHGAAGTFKVTGDLVLSNTVENAASGGTLRFVYDETAGVAPLAVGGKLVIRPGARIEVDLGDYATRKSYKAKRYLVTAAGGIEGDFSSVVRSVVGARADEAVVDADANGVYAHVPRGVLILVR